MPTITVHPSAVLESESSFQSVDGSYPFSNAVGKGTDSDVYAQWYMKTGGAAITRVYYAFDLSVIPENAVITSVTCQAKCQAQNSSSFRGGNTIVALHSGDTNMSSTDNAVFGTSAKVVTVPEVAWTREQLNDCKILIQAARGLLGTSTSYYIRFYGADLTVIYEIPAEGPKLWLKQKGAYSACKNAYKKENGAWVIQSDLAGVFEAGTNYVKK